MLGQCKQNRASIALEGGLHIGSCQSQDLIEREFGCSCLRIRNLEMSCRNISLAAGIVLTILDLSEGELWRALGLGELLILDPERSIRFAPHSPFQCSERF